MTDRRNGAAQHPAAEYNRIRRIILVQANKDVATAREWLGTYRRALGAKGHAGLSAELEFFSQHRRDYGLIPALDSGDATDFAGQIDGRMFRIDVTTNIAFKRLETYEPFQTNGDLYKIAILSNGQFEMLDINFPFCEVCSTGRIFNIGLLHGPNHKAGEFVGTNDQSLAQVCGTCGDYSIGSQTTSHGLKDLDAFQQECWEGLGLDDDFIDDVVRAERRKNLDILVADYATSSMRYLKRQFETPLVGIGSPGYKITGRKGEGHYAVEPAYIDRFVAGRFEGEFTFRFEDLPDRARTA